MRSFICSTLVLLLVISSQAQAAQPEVTITEVFVDFETETIAIMGQNFDLGPDPLTVTLGTFGSLNITTNTSTLLVVDFPDGGLLVGDFLLKVSSGPGPRKNDEHIVTIGAVGPEGAEGAEGAQGHTGPVGPIGPQGPTGATGPQGDTGATGATGPQGPQGDTGAAGAQGVQGPQGDPGEQGQPGMDATPALSGAHWTSPFHLNDVHDNGGLQVCCANDEVAIMGSCGANEPDLNDADAVHVNYSGNCRTAAWNAISRTDDICWCCQIHNSFVVICDPFDPSECIGTVDVQASAFCINP